jgi:hypothetical protein
MRSIGIGLIAALAFAVMAPQAAGAAPKQDPRVALMAAKAREKGKAEAPPLVTAAGLACNVTDARWLGEDKKQAMNIYEVACEQGLGFVLISKAAEPTPTAYTCLETGKPNADGTANSLKCELPANLDQTTALAAFISKAGNPCVVDKARAIGQGQKSAYFEVACKNGAGYIVVTSSPPDASQPVQMNTCLAYEPGGNLYCELTDRAKLLAPIDALVAKAGKSCTISDRRYVLTSKEGANYYEVACASGSGYMVQESAKGELLRILDCANADFISGGCTLTDARASQTEQAALYTRLAGKAGFPCNVAKYAPLPTTGAKEVIELQCKDRPDGGIGVFTASGGKVYNCVLAELEGYRCSFTKKDVVYPKLTASLKNLGKGTCQVSEARIVGKSAEEGFVEVACADGLPGWVIGYPNGSDQPKELLSCLQAASIGGGCKLATNRRG